MAVRKAVAAATITFTAISIKRFFIIVNYQLLIVNSKESPREGARSFNPVRHCRRRCPW